MQRFLTFPEIQRERAPNPLADYILSGHKLLPNHFGPIAPVNIFLGENNSGKSRFMREIMRDKVEFVDIIYDVNIVNKTVNIIKHLVENESLCSMSFSVQLNYTNISYDTDHKSIIDFFYNGSTNYSKYSNLQIDVNEKVTSLLQLILSLNIQLMHVDDLVLLLSTDLGFSDIKQILDTVGSFFRSLSALLISFTDRNKRNIKNVHSGFVLRTNGATVTLQGIRVVAASYQDTSIIEALPKALEPILKDIATIIEQIEVASGFFDDIVSSIRSPASRTYVPTLRSARTLVTKSESRLEADNDIFHHTTSRDYQLADTGVEIDTGFRLYDAIDTTRNARREGRNVFGEFEQFLSDTFFNHKKVEVVAERVRDAHGGSILVAVEGVEHEIHNLGDGIQAIIMLLYPLFIAAEGAWFFIEEPETHLHPGFQRLFIETITTNSILQAKNLTVFLTTHSNHMLDFALEAERQINIYTFRRRAGSGSKSTYEIQLSSPRDIHNLNALGVQNSSVFLANCSIWVEGITDRLYFRAYLAAYLEHLKSQPGNKQPISLLEGLHYAFLEYAGGNISHYSFSDLEGRFTKQTLADIKALSISNRIMLVADADAGKDTRHEARKDQEHNGFIYRVVSGREVENLLSPVLIVKALNKLFSRHNFDPTQLKYADYQKPYLGTYLRQQYPDVNFPVSFIAISNNSSISGTIGSSYKRKFAEAIVASGLAWADLSKPAQSFTKELYQFIISHNPRLGSN